MDYSAQQSYNDLRKVERAAWRERFARKSELVAAFLLLFGLVIALFFPDFRSGVVRNPLLLAWYSAFVVIDAMGFVYYLRRVRRGK